MERGLSVNIPEGVYYRGRFRATLAWSKVSKDRSGDGGEASDNARSLNESGGLRFESGVTTGSGIEIVVIPKGLLALPSR